MKRLRGFVHSWLVISLVLGTMAQTPSAHAQDPDLAKGSFVARSSVGEHPEAKVDFTVETFDRNQLDQKLAQAIAAEPANSLTIVSTDLDPALQQAAKSKLVLMPFGRALKKSSDVIGGVNSFIRNYPTYASNAVREDKIGFGITVFALGNETIRWLHVSDASTFQITANVIYSTLWAAIFLDKDMWSNVTRPVQVKLRKTFKMSTIIPERTSASDMAIKWASSALLSASFNSVRAMIISIDQYSRHTLDVSHAPQILMPIAMGITITSVGFSWSELSGKVREEMYPRAKRIVRFAMNSRSILTTLTASSAMLMNPATFGWHPWAIVSVSGAIGALTFFNAHRIIPRLEAIGKKAQRALPGYKPMTCEALF